MYDYALNDKLIRKKPPISYSINSVRSNEIPSRLITSHNNKSKEIILSFTILSWALKMHHD